MATRAAALKDEGPLTLPDFVAQCADIAEQLLTTLSEERTALAGAATEQFAELFERKAMLAERLDQLETLRQARWPGEAGQLRDTLGTDDRATWDRYVDCLTRCREANTVTGRLVQIRQRHVKDALALLRGDTQAGTSTYDATGTRPDSFDSKPIGSA
ncbi:MAG: flagellar export chaperone FlgN [Pseudomonadota bacterium]